MSHLSLITITLLVDNNLNSACLLPCFFSTGENKEVIKEIVVDCQKKVAQLIRSIYADNVRVMTTTIRKKLVTKVALAVDAESSG